METKCVKIKIDGWQDREKIVTALAFSGHPVWVEERKIEFVRDFYVCIGGEIEIV